jgi:hypothetical protein
MAFEKTYVAGEVLSAGDLNAYSRSLWTPLDKQAIPSTSPVSGVSFTGLSSSYKVFRLTAMVKSGVSGFAFGIRLNNDSGANYTVEQLSSIGSSTSSSSNTGSTYLFAGVGSFLLIGTYIIGKLSTSDRARYTGQGSGTDAFVATASHIGNYGGHWNNTSSLINRIDFLALGETMWGVVGLEGVLGL